MSEREVVSIQKLSTGVPGLDRVLGGGLPEYSFNLIAGAPGTGKTTLVHQIMFANASPDRRAVYFTVLGEPLLKMLRYQQQFTFFDVDELGDTVHFLNLSDEVLGGDLDDVYDSIVRSVEEIRPGIVAVDSFRTIVRAAGTIGEGELQLQEFLQRLALFLASWQATSFLIGEYNEAEIRDNPVFTVADGILWQYQQVQGNSIVRKLQIMKLRGQAPIAGLHPFRITGAGVRVYPRLAETPAVTARPRAGERLASGVDELDEMMGGGIPVGDVVVVAGPSGSGKTLLAAQFIAEGLDRDEPGVIVVFEEYPDEYLRRTERLGMDPEAEVAAGRLRVIRLRPLDLSVDEVLDEILTTAREIGARRIVIDSLSGFEVGLAPTYRDELRDSLYRMVSALTASGVTVLMTIEVAEAFAPPRFTPYAISFLADDIIIQRFIELNGYIQNVIGVVKMRRSEHSRALRLYEISPAGLVLGKVLLGYHGIVTGVPILHAQVLRPTYAGLTAAEGAVLQGLMELRQATVDALRRQTGLDEGDLVPILERLEALRYITVGEEDDQTVYRYEAPPGDVGRSP